MTSLMLMILAVLAATAPPARLTQAFSFYDCSYGTSLTNYTNIHISSCPSYQGLKSCPIEENEDVKLEVDIQALTPFSSGEFSIHAFYGLGFVKVLEGQACKPQYSFECPVEAGDVNRLSLGFRVSRGKRHLPALGLFVQMLDEHQQRLFCFAFPISMESPTKEHLVLNEQTETTEWPLDEKLSGETIKVIKGDSATASSSQDPREQEGKFDCAF